MDRTSNAIVRSYRQDDLKGVAALWAEVFPSDPPWNRAETAIPEKTAFQPDLLLVAEDAGHIVGTAMAGYDGHRGWLYSVAVKPSRQLEGIGLMLVNEAEQRLKTIGCGKINFQVRSTNEAVIGFYARLGYEVEARVSMGKRINAQGPERHC
jgi:ribosomal protein S18 acetylase RimI-like enzyme